MFKQINLRTAVLLGAILLLTFFIFSPSLTNGFVNWNDPEYLLDNPLMRDFSPSGWLKIFFSAINGEYQPLAFLAYTAQYHYFNLNPHSYHLTSLLLHLINCLIVFAIIFRLTRDNETAIITTALFAIHPMQVKAVVWASAQPELLFAFFALLTILSYLKYLRDINHRARHNFFVNIFFLAAIFTSINAVTIPVVLLLLDAWYQKEMRWTYLNKKIPLLIMAGAAGVLAFFLGKEAVVLYGQLPFPFMQRMFLSSAALTLHAGKFFLPFPSSAFYPLPSSLTPGYWASVATWGVLAVILYWARRKNKFIFLGLGFFLLTILPALHFFKPDTALIDEQAMYLPSLGLGLCAAVLLRPLFATPGNKQRIIAILFGGYLIICAVYSNLRTSIWKDSFSLWQNVIAQHPRASFAYHKLGEDFEKRQDFSTAFSLFEKAIAINPHYLTAYFHQGNILAQTKRYRDAVSAYTQALAINPDHAGALTNRGNMHFLLGEYNRAEADYTRVLKQNPHDVSVYKNRGMLFYVQGKKSNALADFSAALVITPSDELSQKKKNELENKLSITNE